MRIKCLKCGTENHLMTRPSLGVPTEQACRKCQSPLTLTVSTGGIEVNGGEILDPEQFTSVPSRLGKYQIVKRLASGGMGDIFLAKQLGTAGFEREVVLKVLHPHLSRDVHFSKELVDEAKITVQLHHPNIVQMYDLERSGELLYCVMEYTAGQSLATIQRIYRRKGGLVPVPMAIYIMVQALDGLEYAHHLTGREGRPLGIVHRDISPQNIMVSSEGWVKIIDFGIAKAAGRITETQPGMVKGKFAYMAPEQFEGNADSRADLFAMGVVLWELLTGMRLFHGENEMDTLRKVIQMRPPQVSKLRPEIPEEMDQILAKAMAKDPALRYASALDFKTSLLQLTAPSTLDDLRAAVDIEGRHLGVEAPLSEAELFADITPVVDSGPKTGPGLGRGASAPSRSFRGLILGVAAVLVLGIGAASALLLPHWFAEDDTKSQPDSGIPGLVADAGLGTVVPELVADAGTAGAAEPEPVLTADAGVIAKSPTPPSVPLTKLTRESIGRVMHKNAAGLQACADLHLGKAGSGQGVDVVLEFTILGSGKVSAAQVTPQNLQGSDFGRCLARRLGALRFPAHLDQSVTISFPLHFQVVPK